MFGHGNAASSAVALARESADGTFALPRLKTIRIGGRRALVALLTFAMVFGSTPAQMWAEGAEGIAQAVEQAGESQGAVSTDAGNASVADGFKAADGTASDAGDAGAADDGASAGDGTASSASSAGVSSEASARAEGASSQTSPSADDGVAVQSSAYLDYVYVYTQDGKDLAKNYTVKVGDTVKVVATYDDDMDDEVEIDSSDYDQLKYQWYVGEKQSSAPTASGYSPIEGATGRELTLTSELVGKYVACKVTYGTSAYAYEFTESTKNAIESDVEPTLTPDAQTLADAVKQLSTWKPDPRYGTDTNIVTMLQDKLAKLGFGNITASLKSVDFSAADPAQQGSIALDGTVTYFFLPSADKTVYSDYTLLRQFKPVYTLALGSESVEFKPSSASTLAWDEAKVQSYLAEQLETATLTASVKTGVAPASATEETLPGALYVNGKKVAELTWTSSDSSAAKIITGYDDDWNTVYKVTFAHGMQAENVTLTAHATLFVSGYGNSPTTSLTQGYDVKVAPKSDEQIAVERAELEEALDRIALKDFTTKEPVDADSVEADLQLPNTRRSGIDAPSGAKLSYSSNNDAVARVNGYRVIITRDIEGGTDDAVITATLTRDGITATRDIAIHVKPIADSEIDEAVAFMNKVKAGYRDALLGENASADAVAKDLSTFSEAAPSASGDIEYRKGASSQYTYVCADDLPGYDSMAGTSWRTYRSSDTSVIQDESLGVIRPTADTLVTVTSNLTYEKYRSLAAAHPENEKLQNLVNQPVTATYRVLGTTDHSDPQISVNFQLVGTAADGADEVWSAGACTVGYGTTADKLIESVLDDLGLAHTSTTTKYGYYLSDITSADGRLLGWDSATGKYWQLFVNGEPSASAAFGVKLNPGDSVVLYYSAYGANLDDIDNASVKASVSFIGPDANGNNAIWAQQTDVRMTLGSTAADLTEQVLKSSGLEYEVERSWGFYLSSITRDGKTYDYDQETGRYWTLYVNGEYSQIGADGVTLKPGDKIQWVYAADSEKPFDGVIVDPSVEGPSWDSDWSGFTSADHVTDAPTPTADAEAKWTSALKSSSDWSTNVSDPLLVGDYLYVAVGGKLLKKDVETGETVAGGEAALAAKIDSTCRMVYTDGFIIVPLSGGRLQAIAADSLATKWVTEALPAGGHGTPQSLSSLTMRDGYVYFGTAEADYSSSYAGNLLCVRLSDGKVMWNAANDSVGYYWSGMAFAGSYGVIADDSGTVSVVDPATGATVSSIKVAERVRSTVLADGSTVYVVSNDGVLHKLSVASDGSISELGSVAFGSSSTSTPVLVNGKIVVGGTSLEGFQGGYQNKYTYHYGQIAVIDADTLEVENTVSKADGNYIRQYGYDAGGDSKSQPVVSVQDGKTYIYFTSNNNPGGIYRYCVGDDEAETLYAPAAADQNYCMASISVGSDGSLYYTNDSGVLFAVKGNGKRLKRYTVTFDLNGATGTAPVSQRVKDSHAVAEPSVPVRAGYTFRGWFKDAACTQVWDFASDVVAADTTLYAGWVKKASGQGGSGTGVAGSGSAFGSQKTSEDAYAKIVLTTNTVSLAGALSGNAEAGEEVERASLLSGFGSKDLATSADDSSDAVTVLSADKGSAINELPIWPFIGMVLGLLALFVALVRRNKNREA